MTRRVATFEWRTPPPTSVEEVLAVYDDGSAAFVVRRPRRDAAVIGSYTAIPADADVRTLAAAGPAPVMFDLLSPPCDAAASDLMAAADRVAATCLASPRAVVTFHAHAASPADGGKLGVTLLAVGAGTEAVEFELDPAGSSVHFYAPDGQPMSWLDLPPLPMGFITPDADSLGGIIQIATIPPGVFGAIAFDTTPPPGATAVSILVAGWLRNAFPDDESPARFEVRTTAVPIPG